MAMNEAAAPVALERPRRDAMPPSLLGVILFVASECVFFAALFGAYFTVRANAPVWPPKGISGLEIPLPAISTTMLVLSSVTMQLAVWAIRRGDRRTMMRFLKLTLLLGGVFLAGQAYDYSQLGFGLTDGTFGTTFFTLTGFHGAHVLGGTIMLSVILYRAMAGQFSARHHDAVEATSIYWHFVDVVWIALFSTLYIL